MNFYCVGCEEQIFAWDNDVIRCLGKRYYHRECWFNEIIQSDAFRRRSRLYQKVNKDV